MPSEKDAIYIELAQHIEHLGDALAKLPLTYEQEHHLRTIANSVIGRMGQVNDELGLGLAATEADTIEAIRGLYERIRVLEAETNKVLAEARESAARALALQEQLNKINGE